MPNKVIKTVFIICGIILFILYVPLIYVSLSLFPFIPWYAEDMSFAVLAYLCMWLPLSVITLAISFMNFKIKFVTSAGTLLPCIAAACVPLILLFGYTDTGGAVLIYIFSALSVLSAAGIIVLTAVNLILRYKSKR